MYSTVVSLNPDPSKSLTYYAWDALNAACALTSTCSTPSVGGGLCRLRHGIDTQVVLTGPGRGAIRVVEGGRSGGTGGSRSGSGSMSSGSESRSAIKRISSVSAVEPEGFYKYVLDTFKRS